MEIIYIIIGVIVGFAICWFAINGKLQSNKASFEQQMRELETAKNKIIAMTI